jgi:hypothetical protein
MLEVRVKRICRTPPYNQAEVRAQLTADLRGLGIPRLDAEPALADKRPNIPLDELTAGRAERLLNLVDQWIENIRAHAKEAETTYEV